MNRKYKLYLFITLLTGLVALWGCPKKTEVATSPEPQKQTENVAAPATPPTPEVPATETKTVETKPEMKAEMAAEGLKPIYFDFDKSFIRDDAKAIMSANVEWLKANPKVKIRIEGNCDERGTVEYNQALGERRAASAKKYLTTMGVSGQRISIISYGKEKPICTEHNEACWQKNRRDDFVVVTE